MYSSRQLCSLPSSVLHDFLLYGNKSINHHKHHNLRLAQTSHSTSRVSSVSSTIRYKYVRTLCHSRRQTNTAGVNFQAQLPRKSPAHLAITPYVTSSSPSRSLGTNGIPASSPQSPQRKGFAAVVPEPLVPYVELIRLDKPTGIYYLFFPCAFSTLIAASLAAPVTGLPEVLKTASLFFVGAMVMRGAGCTINDLWDRNLDPHVERTRSRPIARGAISPRKAIVFTAAQLLTGLGVLVQFPTQCLWYGIPSLLLVGTYPLAKRVTNYPQFVLGLTYSWGAIMGFPALGVDLLADSNAMMAAVSLYSSCVAWTVLYDMVYAQMDVKDDAAAGIKSIALRHKHNTKLVLSSLAITQAGLLAIAGAATGAGPVFFLGSCGGSMIALGTMIWKVRLDDVQNCWWWFKNGCWLTGGAITLGLLGDYITRIFGAHDEDNEKIEFLS
ncbi:Para-hydroxybenzoate--polyprenyltransferase, mitochondrial precursor (PHB:polyprenyltransferase) [Arachnomyces sp. PD_36]|nr:Para-hydroxybenzoate--polyprenyltransferase, mitochondrial precursor (PHB:polyprenyltransferase) [Arachnomyces sp. PD_36]